MTSLDRVRPTYHSLQYMRAVAALLVVLAHTSEYPLSAAAIPGWTARTGDLGVLIFFVISGFIISIVAGPGRFDPIVFAWRRLVRVVPLYWLCTLLLFALALVAPTLFKTTVASGSHLVQSLLFFPHPAPGDGSNFWSPLLKPGWTLNFEMLFYALTASLFWCSTARVRALLLTGVLSVLVALSFEDTSRLGLVDFYASPNLIAFIAGIWLAEVFGARATGAGPSRRLCAAAGLASALALAATFALPPLATILIVPELFAAAGLVGTALLMERAGLIPRMSKLEAVGDASFSLYLTHMFSIAVVWIGLRHVLPEANVAFMIVGVPLSIAVAVAASLVSYRFLERPFLRSSRQQGRRPDSPAKTKTVSASTG